MGMLEDARYDREAKEARFDRYEAKALAESKEYERNKAAYYDRLDRIADTRKAYSDFKVAVYNTLFERALLELMSPALRYVHEDNIDKLTRQTLLDSYIRENGGAQHIMNRTIGKTWVLDLIRETVEETGEEVIAKADPNDPDTFAMDPADVVKAMDKLNNDQNFEDVKAAIAVRVQSAEDAFMDSNRAEKEAMREIVKKAQDKIDQINDDNTKEEDLRQEAAEMVSQRAKRDMFDRRTQNRSVFDAMVHKFATKCVNEESFHEAYLNDQGKINMHRVVNTTRSMYALMETVCTVQYENLDSKFVKNVIDSI